MAREDKRVKKPLTRRQKNKRKLILLGVEVVGLAILLVVLFFVHKLQLIEREEIGEVATNELEEETKESLKGYTNIALLGLDNRSVGNYDSGNADTIIIASINNDTKEIKLVSVYRDTYLKVTEDGSYSKINSAFVWNDGAKGMVEALNWNLDLDISDYVAVDWYALVKTINLLGGIEVELSNGEARELNKLVAENEQEEVTGYHTDQIAYEGLNQLDGVQALAYARIRSLEGDDFARTERQRTVIMKMFEKAKKSSVGTLVKIIDEVFPDIATSLTNGEITQLASGIFSYSLTETAGFPEDRGGATMGNSGSCVIPVSLLTNVEDLHEFLFENEKYTPSIQLQEISNRIIYDSGLAPEPETSETDED